MSPTRLAFGVGALSAAGVAAMVLATLATDHDWWPPGDKTPAYYYHWTLVAAFNCSLVTTAVLTWGAWGTARPLRVGGGGLALVGTILFAWGARPMGSDETMGVTGDLYTDGPYAYTRNPQYLGMIVGITGFAVLSASRYMAALAAAHVGWVLLLPRAEEPHLRAEFGEAYDRYAARVPRFVGRRTIRTAVERLASE